jgi:hypothetical protein
MFNILGIIKYKPRKTEGQIQINGLYGIYYEFDDAAIITDFRDTLFRTSEC